jgi:TolB-like protein/DNA-binding winged helix-turn-helix (wHTH) protein/tetratricopeptide (TPR) repeat protein
LSDVIVFGRFTLDRRKRQLYLDGAPVPVRSAGIRLLLALMERPGQVVTKAELLDCAWGASSVTENALHVHVAALRKTIGRQFIITESGVGYRFVGQIAPPPVTEPDVFAARSTEHGKPPQDGDGVAARDGIRRRLAGRRRLVTAGAILSMVIIVAAGVALRTTRRSDGFVPPPHSVAVLPFTSLSGDPADDYLSDGLSAQLIDALGREKALKVAASTSSFSFRSGKAAAATVGRVLNVGAIIEGSVRRDGHAVRVDAQLVDTVTGNQKWSRSFSSDIVDVPTLQENIATSVIAAMTVTLTGGETSLLTTGGTRNARAYDAALRAEHLMRTVTQPSVRQGLAAFEEALRLDPSYSDAHAGRARALNMINGMWETDETQSDFEAEEALREASQAVSLAPRSAMAHLALAMELAARLHIAAGVTEMTAAHDLNPGNAVIERSYATMQARLGHRAEAEAAISRAIDLDPLTAWNYAELARIFYMNHKYDDALTALRREQSIGGDDPTFGNMIAALVHLAQGKPAAIFDDCRLGCIGSAAWHAIAYMKLGRKAEAQESLLRLLKETDDDNAPYCTFVYSQWGERESALHWLEITMNEHSGVLQDIRVEPLLDPLRATPEFRDTERQLNMPL